MWGLFSDISFLRIFVSLYQIMFVDNKSEARVWHED